MEVAKDVPLTLERIGGQRLKGRISDLGIDAILIDRQRSGGLGSGQVVFEADHLIVACIKGEVLIELLCSRVCRWNRIPRNQRRARDPSRCAICIEIQA